MPPKELLEQVPKLTLSLYFSPKTTSFIDRNRENLMLHNATFQENQ
jgi:hypothetical protein